MVLGTWGIWNLCTCFTASYVIEFLERSEFEANSLQKRLYQAQHPDYYSGVQTLTKGHAFTRDHLGMISQIPVTALTDLNVLLIL